jgi:hypothetical protein
METEFWYAIPAPSRFLGRIHPIPTSFPILRQVSEPVKQ